MFQAGTSTRRPELISQTNASVFVSARLAWSLAPPAANFEQNEKSPIQEDPYDSKGYTHRRNLHMNRFKRIKPVEPIEKLSLNWVAVPAMMSLPESSAHASAPPSSYRGEARMIPAVHVLMAHTALHLLD